MKVKNAVNNDKRSPIIYGNVFSVDHLLIDRELLLKDKRTLCLPFDTHIHGHPNIVFHQDYLIITH